MAVSVGKFLTTNIYLALKIGNAIYNTLKYTQTVNAIHFIHVTKQNKKLTFLFFKSILL